MRPKNSSAFLCGHAALRTPTFPSLLRKAIRFSPSNRTLIGAQSASGNWEHRILNGVGLLEELTRTYSTSPERLEDIDQIVRDLTEVSGGEAVVTPEFLELWSVFEQALESRNG